MNTTQAYKYRAAVVVVAVMEPGKPWRSCAVVHQEPDGRIWTIVDPINVTMDLAHNERPVWDTAYERFPSTPSYRVTVVRQTFTVVFDLSTINTDDYEEQVHTIAVTSVPKGFDAVAMALHYLDTGEANMAAGLPTEADTGTETPTSGPCTLGYMDWA
jgi:hypothetical protein